MPVKRTASFGTYFFIGFSGMLVGSVIGKVLIDNVFQPGAITKLINLYGFANLFIVKIGGQAGYLFNLNLIAIIGIIFAIFIYRRI